MPQETTVSQTKPRNRFTYFWDQFRNLGRPLVMDGVQLAAANNAADRIPGGSLSVPGRGRSVAVHVVVYTLYVYKQCTSACMFVPFFNSSGKKFGVCILTVKSFSLFGKTTQKKRMQRKLYEDDFGE